MLATAFGWAVNPLTFRLLRMLRVVKLVRLIRASRILKRWRDHIGFSFAYLSLLRFVLITVVLGFVDGGAQKAEITQSFNVHDSVRTQNELLNVDTHIIHFML